MSASKLVIAISVIFACGCAEQAARLSSIANIGPCPASMSLHDVARIVEIEGEELYNNVSYTGEILQVRSWCRYFEDLPISMQLQIDFALGRGPAALEETHNYEWFIAVTRRNSAVAATEKFVFEAKFPEGENIIYHTENIGQIIIPRAGADLLGSNFEILTGFVLTSEQLAFNQSGKRFRIDAGG